ncbi:MAG: plastocyanin [Limimaricola cinnabarinus]|jgi:plastocyanin
MWLDRGRRPRDAAPIAYFARGGRIMPTRRRFLLRGLAATAALPLWVLAARAGGLAAAATTSIAPPATPRGAPPPRPAMGRLHEVEIKGFAFLPAALTIAAGDMVIFTNADLAPHTATSETGLFDSGRLGRGQSVRMSFATPGTYPYLCTLHPKMRGTITVA